MKVCNQRNYGRNCLKLNSIRYVKGLSFSQFLDCNGSSGFFSQVVVASSGGILKASLLICAEFRREDLIFSAYISAYIMRPPI